MSAIVDAVVMASASPKERPILFSGPMVRAILEGCKTQTRRIIKSQPQFFPSAAGGSWGWYQGKPPCPFGEPGNRLWVREKCRVASNTSGKNAWHSFEYAAGGPSPIRDGEIPGKWFPSKSFNADGSLRWQPSIHMPRWASRITLEITGVRVERLQDISEEDARAEGVSIAKSEDGSSGYGDTEGLGRFPQYSLRWGFKHLWESINSEGSWAANPWVWVVEFKRLG